MPNQYSVNWLCWWKFQRPDWYAEPDALGALVEALLRSVWWRHLDRMGVGFKAGSSLPSLDGVVQTLRRKSPATFSFAQGGAESVTWGDSTQCLLRLEIMRSYFSLQCSLRGEALTEAGAASLDSAIEVVLALRRAWAEVAYLQYAEAFPVANPRFDYTRAHPELASNTRSLCALVHIVDPDVSVTEDQAWRQAENVRLATSKLPKSFTREQRDGAIIIRSVIDPTDVSKVRRAATTHERWIVPLIETLPADD